MRAQTKRRALRNAAPGRSMFRAVGPALLCVAMMLVLALPVSAQSAPANGAVTPGSTVVFGPGTVSLDNASRSVQPPSGIVVPVGGSLRYTMSGSVFRYGPYSDFEMASYCGNSYNGDEAYRQFGSAGFSVTVPFPSGCSSASMNYYVDGNAGGGDFTNFVVEVIPPAAAPTATPVPSNVGVTVTGHVCAEPGGQAVACNGTQTYNVVGATVEALASDNTVLGTGTSDSSGAYSLTASLPAGGTLRVSWTNVGFINGSANDVRPGNGVWSQTVNATTSYTVDFVDNAPNIANIALFQVAPTGNLAQAAAAVGTAAFSKYVGRFGPALLVGESLVLVAGSGALHAITMRNVSNVQAAIQCWQNGGWNPQTIQVGATVVCTVPDQVGSQTEAVQLQTSGAEVVVETDTQTAATPTPNATATAQAQATSTPQTQPTATPQTQPTSTPQTQPTATPQTQPTATPQTQPTATPSGGTGTGGTGVGGNPSCLPSCTENNTASIADIARANAQNAYNEALGLATALSQDVANLNAAITAEGNQVIAQVNANMVLVRDAIENSVGVQLANAISAIDANTNSVVAGVQTVLYNLDSATSQAVTNMRSAVDGLGVNMLAYYQATIAQVAAIPKVVYTDTLAAIQSAISGVSTAVAGVPAGVSAALSVPLGQLQTSINALSTQISGLTFTVPAVDFTPVLSAVTASQNAVQASIGNMQAAVVSGVSGTQTAVLSALTATQTELDQRIAAVQTAIFNLPNEPTPQQVACGATPVQAIFNLGTCLQYEFVPQLPIQTRLQTVQAQAAARAPFSVVGNVTALGSGFYSAYSVSSFRVCVPWLVSGPTVVTNAACATIGQDDYQLPLIRAVASVAIWLGLFMYARDKYLQVMRD